MRLLFVLLSLIMMAAAAPAAVVFTVFQGGFQDENNAPTNGMNFGFIIDVNNNGFDVGSYTSFDLNSNSQSLYTTFGKSDDVYVFDTNNNQTLQSFLGAGSIGIATVPYLEATTGNNFGLIWFPTSIALAGSPYGFATDFNFIVPNNGGVTLFPANDLSKTPNYIIAIPEIKSFVSLVSLIIAFCFLFCRKR